MSKAFLVCGLAFGDESKGATTDKLCREFPVDLIVRYGGGCQCAHNVVTPEGVHHTFSQFGSGMLVNNDVRTHLSQYMLVEPLSMIREANMLNTLCVENVWHRTTVHPEAVVTTILHRQLNQLREEARGVNRYGSCGRGIGVTRELELIYGKDKVLLARDFDNGGMLADKLDFMWNVMKDETHDLAGKLNHNHEVIFEPLDYLNIYRAIGGWPARISEFEPAETMIFEGAQGVMLDEVHGTAPHNTWTDTTFNNAHMLCDEARIPWEDRFRLGCLRSYYTRHGAGPFPTEDKDLDLPEPHNDTGSFQGAFRVGAFDFTLARRAVDIVGGVDGLAISHLDKLPQLGLDEEDEEDFLRTLEEYLQAPVRMRGYGPKATDRAWSEQGALV